MRGTCSTARRSRLGFRPARAYAPRSEQVAEQLDITVSGARQHLSALTRDGLVEGNELATGAKRGRRALVYVATGAADAYFPNAYGEVTNELLGYVADTDRALLDELFAKRREARIANAQARLAKKRTLGARVAELTRILDGAEVERVQHMIAGGRRCADEVRAR